MSTEINLDDIPDYRNPSIPRLYWFKEYSDTDIPYGVRIGYMIPPYASEPKASHKTRPIVALDMFTGESKKMGAIEAVKHFGAGAIFDVANKLGIYKGQYLLYYQDQAHFVTDDLLERRQAEIVARKAFSH